MSRRIIRSFLLVVSLVVIPGVLPGCSGSDGDASADALRQDGKALFGGSGLAAADRARAGVGAGWTVVLAGFRGDDAKALANTAMLKIRELPECSEAFVEQRGATHIVGLGRFDSPGDAAARQLLQRVRTMEVGQQRPFASAVLFPPDTNNLNSGVTGMAKPEWNLTKVRELFGKEARYTLQIATFGGPQPGQGTADELAQARIDAETATSTLRKQGELAFYYHSPRMSTVTVGLFDDATLDNPLDPDLVALRKKYPNRLHNGAGLKTRVNGGRDVLEDSKLVAVPER